MTIIRDYCETDAASVGMLIADTYGEFNLSYASPKERDLLLGPFRHARSPKSEHQEAIARVIRAEMVFVAEDRGEIVGMLRGGPGRLRSLFVRKDHHRQGLGRRLVERFEGDCLRHGATTIRVASTLYALPFYTSLGYKRTTGVRTMRSFDGAGLRYQPMKKVLASAEQTSE